MAKKILIIVGALIVLFGLIQLVPYGRDHSNPPVVSEPNWNSPETRAMFQTACFDCHSNEVVYPWYSNIAPASWLIQHDIEEGRQNVNFSDWGQFSRAGYEVSEVISEGEMPPFQYTIIHANARLSQAQREQMLAGWQATFGQ